MSDQQPLTPQQSQPQAVNVTPVAAGQVRLQQVLASGAQNVNVLTSAGQQFVITSQVNVPGLQQVIPSAALQQAGVTRILNIAQPRVNVVGGTPVARTVTVSSGDHSIRAATLQDTIVRQLATSGGVVSVVNTNPSNSGETDVRGRHTVSLALGQQTTIPANIGQQTIAINVSQPSTSKQSIGTVHHIGQLNVPTLTNSLTPTRRTGATSLNQLSQTSVVLSGNVIRTTPTGAFVTPITSPVRTLQSPVTSPQPRKKLKLEEKPPPNEEVGNLRKQICDYKGVHLHQNKENYIEHVAELFFLQSGGNMMDYPAWRKRPTPQFVHFLKSHALDSDDDEFTSPEIKVPSSGGTPVAVSTSLPAAVAQLSQQGFVPGRPQGGRHGMVFAMRQALTTTDGTVNSSTPVVPAGGTPLIAEPTASGSTTVPVSAGKLSTSPSSQGDKRLFPSTPKLTKGALATQGPRQIMKQHSISSLYDNTLGSQEQIVEKAKQEAYVMQRITELQREGLWSEKRLPKVQEPPRAKAHWDYLLEEMVWLAADFAQERKWKKAAAKKCARMVQKHFQEKAIQAQKAEKVQELRLKKIASHMAKEVKTFWNNVEKLVEFKQQTRLEEKRKKALDQHLSFIVDQTEKYSSWLAESMNKSGDAGGTNMSVDSSRASSPIRKSSHSDDEFEPNQSSSDDEETIAKAEEDMETHNHIEEIEMLKRESELPLEDLLKDLPEDYLENLDRIEEVKSEESSENSSVKGDEDYTVETDKEMTDDEATIQEQEEKEKNVDHKKELEDLHAESEIPIEELLKNYPGGFEDSADKSDLSDEDGESKDNECDNEGDGDDEDEDEEEESPEEEEEDEGEEESEMLGNSKEDFDVSLKSLLDGDDDFKKESSDGDGQKDLTDVAALVETFQPKGNTLSSTSVVTKVPFLLKHQLREYQHIGLDWLVTMYDRKLNGILADEMGLGKTIQTIALLGHLACEKGNWGPHLIIVPTSVMLNWEIEFKKWCPGFKILTYYGSQKERRQKRTGWTKPNAFHVCITSYKLVIQDHQSFRRKKWKYLILDEAQNIKNFKSQRWQLLLNFQTQRRLLLTGTPLQNSLMELWSLMHFLMPNVFQSHREFKEWFSNPVTGMIEGNSEYNDSIIKRLHKVLRPFLLRRLKTEVEKQLPKKFEHIVMCRLSKRQRYLYDDFMSRAKTKETLATGNLLSVINVLMQLRKVCNHPNLFEVRPTTSPFQMEGLTYHTASIVWNILDYDPFKHVDLFYLNFLLIDLELCLTAFAAHRIRKFQPPRRLIEEIDSSPDPPPRCPSGKIKLHVRVPAPPPANNPAPPTTPAAAASVRPGVAPSPAGVVNMLPRLGAAPVVRTPQGVPQGVTFRVAGGSQLQGYSVQLVQHQGGVKVAALAPTQIAANNPAPVSMQVKQDGIQRFSVPAGFAQLVQTSTGQHILLTSSPQVVQPLNQTQNLSQVAGVPQVGTATVLTSSGQRLTVLSRPVSSVVTTTVTTVNRIASSGIQTVMTQPSIARPNIRMPPLSLTAPVAQMPVTAANTSVLGTTTVTTVVTSAPTITSASLTQPVSAPSVQSRGASVFSSHALMARESSPVTSSIVTRHEARIAAEERRRKEHERASQSVFYLPELEEKKKAARKAKLSIISKFNTRHCEACPIYGPDLIEAVRRIVDIPEPCSSHWKGMGFVHCKNITRIFRSPEVYWNQTKALRSVVHTPSDYVKELHDIFQRFVFCVPAVSAPHPRFHVSHPLPSKLWEEKRREMQLQLGLSPHTAVLHPITSAMVTQFPDPRLIQYDCGKLQVLDQLLRRLKIGHHRVLIFTQMTRMLDVLEAFLNYHGHIYLRLDGTTRVDQRQVLMERFNADKRIFCFILSTRSGGIGVNLTGADTVIFYDSDWNPTMDAQAQDRCHRIGQTRDVHIYRLVSEKTVEENILKKANQKRMLGDLAIEGGNFTTAYFKSSTIQDLFDIDLEENDASRRMAEVLDREQAKEIKEEPSLPSEKPQPVVPDDRNALGALESALAAAEDETDVQAARTAKAEAAADLAEFDENIPLDENEHGEEISKAELEIKNLIEQLSPIERYAMKFVEDTEAAWAAEQLAAAEAEIEQQKKEWELGRLQALREEEERRATLTDDELLTFSEQDSHNQVNKKSIKGRPQGWARNKVRGRPENRRRKISSRSESCKGEGESDSSSTHTKISLRSRSTEGKHEEEASCSGDGGGDLGEFRCDENPMGEVRASKSPQFSSSSSTSSAVLNHVGDNSPRTRSRGTVSINLWTLDVSPILPGVKPVSPSRKESPTARNQVAKVKCSGSNTVLQGNKVRSEKTKSKNNSHVSNHQDGSQQSPKVNSIGNVPVNSSPIVPQPYSNPNLVIRTRRASMIEVKDRNCERSRCESESGNSEVDVVTLTNDCLPITLDTISSIKRLSVNSKVPPVNTYLKSRRRSDSNIGGNSPVS